ncbi:chain-length determining protein, partial [Escherichia coli]|nr:chain-length determining protein [Escherichia coli]
VALGVAWGIALIGWLAISLVPNRYESTARIFVQTGSVLSDKVGISPNDQRADVDRVRQTLTSGENLTQVVKSTDLARQA